MIRQFEAPDLLRHGSGERSLLVSEKLAFEQAGGDGRAVYFDEAAPAAAAHLVNGAGHELLSRACFAQYQNGCIGRRDYLNAFQNGLESRPLADHVAVVVVEPDLVLQVKLLGSEPLLYLLELPVRQGVFHGDGNLSCHLHQKIDIFVRPNVAGSSGEFERPERSIAGDQRNRAGGLAAQLHEPAVLGRGVASPDLHRARPRACRSRAPLPLASPPGRCGPAPCQKAEPQ